MEHKRRKRTPSSNQIRMFATDLYEYIWTKHTFCNSRLEKKFAEQLSLKFLQIEDAENSPFNEDIGKAVLCSQYLLRDVCSKFFKRMKKYMTLSKSTFIYCVYLTQYICREFRADIFLRFIDACAIIADAFLFCDAETKSFREIDEAPEMLIALFELQISKTFFEKGGWSQLQKQALDQCSTTFAFMTPYITKLDNPYATLPHDCKLTQFLRDSPVMYPVHISKLCGQCILDTDQDACYSFDTEYPVEDFIKQYSLKLPPIEKDEIQVILSQDEACADSKSSLDNSKSYIFLGSSEVNAELFDEKEKKQIFKKRKRKFKLLS